VYDKNEAHAMSTAFLEQVAHAKKNNLSPGPTLRKLLDVADEWIDAQKSLKKIIEPVISQRQKLINTLNTTIETLLAIEKPSMLEKLKLELDQLSVRDNTLSEKELEEKILKYQMLIDSNIEMKKVNLAKYKDALNIVKQLSLDFNASKKLHDLDSIQEKFFGWSYSGSWQSVADEKRNKAFQEIIGLLSSFDNDGDRLTLLKETINLPVFTEHRGSFFTSNYYHGTDTTDAEQNLRKLEQLIQLHQKNKTFTQKDLDQKEKVINALQQIYPKELSVVDNKLKPTQGKK